jgi:hypothetical protein
MHGAIPHLHGMVLSEVQDTSSQCDTELSPGITLPLPYHRKKMWQLRENYKCDENLCFF